MSEPIIGSAKGNRPGRLTRAFQANSELSCMAREYLLVRERGFPRAKNQDRKMLNYEKEIDPFVGLGKKKKRTGGLLPDGEYFLLRNFAGPGQIDSGAF